METIGVFIEADENDDGVFKIGTDEGIFITLAHEHILNAATEIILDKVAKKKFQPTPEITVLRVALQKMAEQK